MLRDMDLKKPIINTLMEKNKNYKKKNSVNIDMRSFFFKNIERPLVEFSKVSLGKSYTIDLSDYENQLNFDFEYISKTLNEKGFYSSWYDNELLIMWVRNFENNESDLLSTVRKNQSYLAEIKIKEYVYNDMFKEIFKSEYCEDRVNIDIPDEFKYEDYIDILFCVLKKDGVYAEYNERSGDFYVYTFGTYDEVKNKLDMKYNHEVKKTGLISKLGRLFKK